MESLWIEYKEKFYENIVENANDFVPPWLSSFFDWWNDNDDDDRCVVRVKIPQEETEKKYVEGK